MSIVDNRHLPLLSINFGAIVALHVVEFRFTRLRAVSTPTCRPLGAMGAAQLHPGLLSDSRPVSWR